MNDEKFLILKMVEEGKITSEEAAALLDALEADKAAGLGKLGDHGGTIPTLSEAEARGGASSFERLRDALEHREDAEFKVVLEEEARRFAKNVEAAAEKFSRLVEERIEKEVKPALANLPAFLAKIPVIGEWVGEFSTVTEERQGAFLDSTIRLELSTDNGSIEVQGWPESHYHMVLKKKVRGNDEEAVRERAAEVVQVEESGNWLRVKGRTGINEAVHIKLSVPQDKLYELAVSTSNGRITITSLKDVMGSITTSNGRVTIKDLQGTRLAARTSNGTIECDNINLQELILNTSNGRISADGFAQRLEARTSNGSIEVTPRLGSALQEQSLDLHTANSGIQVNLPPALAGACWLDLSGGFGSINVNLNDMLYHIKEDYFGSKRVQGETKGYGTANARIRVVARSANGGITIDKIQS
ncbi:MAG: DUF4097 family beta strand repeat-containing protein [Limnochordia bacterium]